jgi:three-Cys-motif partner protein
MAMSAAAPAERKTEKTSTEWEVNPHQQAKTNILKVYLQAWFPILSTQGSPLAYIDAFAGPGAHEHGENVVDGSPLVVINLVNDHKALLDRLAVSGQPIHLIFIEKDAGRSSLLQQRIRSLPAVDAAIKTHVLHGEFDVEFDRIMTILTGAHIPTFAFIDPFGYSLPFQSVKKVLAIDKGEVMINLMTGYIVRFVNNERVESCLTDLYGGEHWKTSAEWSSLTPLARQEHLVEAYKESLKSAGALYVWEFRVRGKNNSTIFHLVFATKHRKGLIQMKSAMWKNQFTSYMGERMAFSDRFARMDDGQLAAHGPGLNEHDHKELEALITQKFVGTTTSWAAVEDFVWQKTQFIFQVETIKRLIKSRHIRGVISSSQHKRKQWASLADKPQLIFASGDRKADEDDDEEEMTTVIHEHFKEKENILWKEIAEFAESSTWFGIGLNGREEFEALLERVLSQMVANNNAEKVQPEGTRSFKKALFSFAARASV